ncbi:MAG: hypothetical protein ACYS9X_21925 [Planctomycetota bacterium]
MMSWRRLAIVLVGGPAILVLAYLLGATIPRWLRSSTPPSPFECYSTSRSYVGNWRYEEGGVVVTDLRIEMDHKGLTHTAPRASVTITNSTDSPQTVAVDVALYGLSRTDLIASFCLEPSETAVVAPGTTVSPVETLSVSLGIMEQWCWTAIRVRRE